MPSILLADNCYQSMPTVSPPLSQSSSLLIRAREKLDSLKKLHSSPQTVIGATYFYLEKTQFDFSKVIKGPHVEFKQEHSIPPIFPIHLLCFSQSLELPRSTQTEKTAGVANCCGANYN
ncbi:hypothetical protein GOODEAATRI_002085 [Goodea atripinnis]|uniref:Uncharacterized protein n=1 Tax=Goodea atripinnis TaxID=208336 RepID=A0ABV0MYS3_9TELE